MWVKIETGFTAIILPDLYALCNKGFRALLDGEQLGGCREVEEINGSGGGGGCRDREEKTA